jgi:hypothetical protein
MRLNRVMILSVLLTLTSLGPEATFMQGVTAAQLQEGRSRELEPVVLG